MKPNGSFSAMFPKKSFLSLKPYILPNSVIKPWTKFCTPFGTEHQGIIKRISEGEGKTVYF